MSAIVSNPQVTTSSPSETLVNPTMSKSTLDTQAVVTQAVVTQVFATQTSTTTPDPTQTSTTQTSTTQTSTTQTSTTQTSTTQTSTIPPASIQTSTIPPALIQTSTIPPGSIQTSTTTASTIQSSTTETPSSAKTGWDIIVSETLVNPTMSKSTLDTQAVVTQAVVTQVFATQTSTTTPDPTQTSTTQTSTTQTSTTQTSTTQTSTIPPASIQTSTIPPASIQTSTIPPALIQTSTIPPGSIQTSTTTASTIQSSTTETPSSAKTGWDIIVNAASTIWGRLTWIWDCIISLFSSKPSEVTESTTSTLSFTEQCQQMAAENPTHHLIFYLDGITSFLGNFYPTSIHYNKMNFQCAEAAYQSRKFDNFPDIQKQFCAINGNEAFRLAQKFKDHIPKNWFQINHQIMTDVIDAKFTQNAKLAEQLLNTEQLTLREETHKKGRDTYWATNPNPDSEANIQGQNQLGILLMNQRRKMQEAISTHK